MTLKSSATRFRAYQLENAGSSFSYCSGSNFVLIEGRYTEANKGNIGQEMELCGVQTIQTLHITSWDQDHCSPSQLEQILIELKPNRVEYPGYLPHTTSGTDSLKLITSYKNRVTGVTAIAITPAYIKSLDKSESYGYKDVLYWPKEIDSANANNNSNVKQFRSGCFNVLSLGDLESNDLSAYLRSFQSISSEVDVMIMAHHGADNGFTSSAFIKAVKPTLAISTSNFGNQFDHPRQEIRDLLHKHEVKLFTTKTGDVIVQSTGGHFGEFQVVNLKANSTEISSQYVGKAKKFAYLQNNADALRVRRTLTNRGPHR